MKTMKKWMKKDRYIKEKMKAMKKWVKKDRYIKEMR